MHVFNQRGDSLGMPVDQGHVLPTGIAETTAWSRVAQERSVESIQRPMATQAMESFWPDTNMFNKVFGGLYADW